MQILENYAGHQCCMVHGAWCKPHMPPNHRYRKYQNRLLKVCCVHAITTGLPRVSFFFSFLFLLQWPFTVLIKQTRQAVRAVKQSIYILRILCHKHIFSRKSLTETTIICLCSHWHKLESFFFFFEIFFDKKQELLSGKMMLQIGEIKYWQDFTT